MSRAIEEPSKKPFGSRIVKTSKQVAMPETRDRAFSKVCIWSQTFNPSKSTRSHHSSLHAFRQDPQHHLGMPGLDAAIMGSDKMTTWLASPGHKAENPGSISTNRSVTPGGNSKVPFAGADFKVSLCLYCRILRIPKYGLIS